MKAVMLDGSTETDVTGERVRAALLTQLQAQGWQVEHLLLREKKIGNCAGDFFCWVRSPGVCNIDDDNREIAAAIVHSDLLVYLTPVTFGGYSSALKKAVDHQVQNILPFFAQVNGETHHAKRYKNYPNCLTIGWLEAPNPQAEAVFKHLAWRNALNMYAKSAVSGVVLANQTDGEVSASVQGWLKGVHNGTRPQPASLPENGETGPGVAPIRRALLLVGSPRTRKSTSNSLGGYLFERLGAQNVQTETIYLHTVLRSQEKSNHMLEAVGAADLVLLAFPLYVDSLPAPAIEALERIAAHREAQGDGTHPTPRQLFAAIANCGFPEAHHNDTALAICTTFARQAGFEWAGSLALGAGEGMVHGAPLNEMDGRAIPLKKALDLAADALAQGQAIPQAAQALWDKPFIPPWLYRLMGSFGWRQQSKRWQADKMLKRQPYAIQ
ncbi:MAG: NAD(P)H-dependent oxidoreductase [Chloroflexota bacterium]